MLVVEPGARCNTGDVPASSEFVLLGDRGRELQGMLQTQIVLAGQRATIPGRKDEVLVDGVFRDPQHEADDEVRAAEDDETCRPGAVDKHRAQSGPALETSIDSAEVSQYSDDLAADALTLGI